MVHYEKLLIEYYRFTNRNHLHEEVSLCLRLNI